MSTLQQAETDGRAIVADAAVEVEKDDEAAAVKVVEDAVLKGTPAEQDMALRFAIGACMPLGVEHGLEGPVWELYKALQARRDALEGVVPILVVSR